MRQTVCTGLLRPSIYVNSGWRFVRLASLVCALAAGASTAAHAQSTVYHLHNEASTTPTFKQLTTAGPDAAQAALQTAALQNVAVGEKQIAQFDTATGVPGVAGRIASGATVSAVVWMRKTANFGTMFPRVKVRLNSSSGTSLCTATGTTALTTTLTSYSISCTTTANVTVTASDRLYVWNGVNLTAASNGGAFRGELGVEGTANSAADSRVTVPNALAAPVISSLTPAAGPIGQVVTITGSNFGSQQLGSTVKFFNNKTATATSWSNTSITTTVPTGAVTGNVTVTVAGLASGGVSFGVGTVPVISNLSPTAGLPGGAVTITGTGFGATKGSSTVKFNGVTATTTGWSATSITATVPAAATTGNVIVTVSTVSSAGTPFTVPTLVTLSVVPQAATVPIRGRQRFAAVGHYSDGVDRDVSASATWTSTDDTVGTVDISGLSEVVATTGMTAISATVGASNGVAQLSAAPSRFHRVGSLHSPRRYHASAILGDGRVLVTGGQDGSGNVTASAEIYDPATGRFTPTGNMLKKRHLHTATPLLDGTVLIAGGTTYYPDEDHSTAEIYDPATGTFSYTAGSMGVPYLFHSATRLADGRVLIAQGYNGLFPWLPAAVVYDPATRTFSAAGSPTIARAQHTSTLLADGRVLISGGSDNNGMVTASTDVYDPVSNSFSAGPPLTVGRQIHAAARLLDGRVLISGANGECPLACSAEISDVATPAATAVASMSVGRAAHTSTPLDDGQVLVVGGQAGPSDTGTAELFDPVSQTFVAAGSMSVTRWGHTATKLLDGSVLIVGGWGQMAGNSAELYATAPIAATSLSVSPSTATLQVGEARSFTVVDQLTFGRSDAEWSVSDPNVATVDIDSGVVTAVAPGTAVVTATVGAVTATAQVAVVAAGSLPAGAVRWTVAAPAGFTTKQVVQAHDPDEGSPLSFVVNGSASDTQIVALSADGRLLWQFWFPTAATNVVPSSSGGVIATLYNSCDGVNPMRLVSIDGATGWWAWEFVGATTCGNETPRVSVRTDGAVAVATPGNLTGFPSFMLLSGTTGTPLPVPAIPSSTFTSFNGQQVPGISRVGPAMTDRDGVVHLLYEKRLVGYPPQVIDTGIWLLSVMPDQSYTTTQLSSTTDNTNLFPGYIIPDGTGGLVATWVDSPIVPAGMPPAQSTFRAARITAASVVTNFDIPLVPPVDLPKQTGSALPVNPILTLGEDQRAFVTYVDKLVAFSLADGSLIWDHQAPSGTMTAVRSDLSNGIVAKNTVGGVDTVLRFTASGGYTIDPVSGSGVDYSRGLGWIGTSSSSGSGATAYSGSPINLSTAGWSSPTQDATAAADPLVKLKEPKQTNPEQAKIKVTYEAARDLLVQDAQLPNPTCSTWFNTGFPMAGFATSAPNYIDVKVLPGHFAHAVILVGGQEAAGERISAFQGEANGDSQHTLVGALPDTLLTFNRSGTFFKENYSFFAYNPVRPHNIGGTLQPNGTYLGGYGGNSKRAQLTIALHELAHLLQTAPISVNTVPGFQADGGDPTGGLSRANTTLLLDKCKTLIERYH